MLNKKILDVLIVDDEEEITKLLSYTLRSKSYNIITSNSAMQALEIFSKNSIDILVTDIKMPYMDGFELSKKVIEMYPDTQIIVISAHSDVDSALEALKIGAVHFLQKPISPNILLFAINSAAEKWRLKHQLQAAYNNLEREKEFLAVTLRSIGDGVIATDLEGKITVINRIAEELTGWTLEEAIGKKLTEIFRIINEKTKKICENPVKKVLETGRIIGLANHTALIARNGLEKSIADSAAPIRDRDSNIIGVVLVFRDVTMAKRINLELAKTKKLESVGILAAGIAHDFNNLLMGIMGNINLSKTIFDKDHEVYEYLDAAEKASKRAAKLTKQLLTFSKGGGQPIKEAVSIYEIVKESSDFTLSGSNINCRIDRDSNLWAADIDKGQISQVIENIILNARQAMPEGGTIHILCENYYKATNNEDGIPIKKGSYIKLIISDEGVGIPIDYIERIFDPYYTTKKEGSGLGLAITYSIVKKHKGHILCESEPGKGCTFKIYLPATKESIITSKAKNKDNKGHGTILIMDDEQMILTAAHRMLKRSGYEVIEANDGAQAVEIYIKAMKDKKRIDLIIMDLTIPGGMGGVKAIQKLLEIDPNVCAVVSSGYSNDPVMANYKKYGFKATLDKPYLMDQLIKVVSQVINS